jgi:hypothetical protein
MRKSLWDKGENFFIFLADSKIVLAQLALKSYTILKIVCRKRVKKGMKCPVVSPCF